MAKLEEWSNRMVGPYTHGGTSIKSDAGEVLAYSHYDDDHPSPITDGIKGGWGDGRVCGINSLDGIRRWFEGWWHTLEREGFQLLTYEVPDDRVSKANPTSRTGQVVFDPEDGTLVAQERIKAKRLETVC